MKRYFFFRFCSMLFSLFFVVSLTFFVMKSIPGNPFLKDQNTPKEILETLYSQYSFDQPIFTQYLIYLKKFFFLEFGSSLLFENKSVIGIIKEGFPISFFLGLQSLFISVSLGMLLGSIAALNRKKWQDNLLIVFFAIGISTPSFLLATFLQYILTLKFSLFPIAKWEGFLHSILPSISLAILPSCFIARLVRDNMIHVLGRDYIKLAKAKGIGSFQLVTRHLLKNSFFPLLGYLAPLCANIVLGSFVIEKIFGIPGIGGWLITSILSRDYPLIMGLSLFFSFLLMFSVFIFDLLCYVIDPRIQHKKTR